MSIQKHAKRMFQLPYWAKKGKHIFPSALIKILSARIFLTLGRFPHLRSYKYKFYSNFPRLLLSPAKKFVTQGRLFLAHSGSR